MKMSPAYLRIVAVFGLIILVVCVVVVSNAEKPLSWEPTWSGSQDDPFANRVMREMATTLLAPAELEIVRKSPMDLEPDQHWLDRGALAYIFINDVFDPYPEEWEVLKEWVRKGNAIWVSASYASSYVQEDLGIKIGALHVSEWIEGEEEDSVACFFHAAGWPGDRYLIPERYLHGLVNTSENAPASEPLMATFGGTPTAMSIRLGAGQFVFCACPRLMTNYGLLTPEYTSMVSGMLSFIPQTVQKIYWDEWIKVGNRRRDHDRDQEDSPGAVAFLWQHEALRAAFILALAGLLLYVIFQTKRIQRIIPPQDPLTNTTLDFTRTVGRLYAQHQNHAQLAQKRIAAFRDQISEQYLLSEPWGSEGYARQLAAKSGKDPEEAQGLIQTMVRIEASDNLSETGLLEMSRRIDDFTQHPEPHHS